MRSAAFVGWLAWRRLRRHDSGAVFTALGLAAAAAVLATVHVGVTIATDRATAQAVERIPADGRSIRAVWFGVPSGEGESLPILDRQVRDVFAGLPLAGPVSLALVRESTVEGEFVGLTGVDGLAPHVILRSGRLPRLCRPERCEVLRLRGEGRLPSAPGLRIVEVGTGTLRSRQLFGDFLEPTDRATADAVLAPALRRAGRYHRPELPPLVVAEGTSTLASSPVLGRTYRSYAWVWPLAPGAPRLWEIDRLIDRVERARIELAAYSRSFAVDAPQEELRAVQESATISGRRLLLVGGEVAALLLAFAVLAARSMRRDLEAARRRLTWYGARRWQLWLLVGIESAAVAVSGVVVGWILGTAAGALAARLAGAPAVPVLDHSIFSAAGLGLALAAVVTTAAVIAVVVSVRSRNARFGPLELIAGAALLVVGIALLAGAADRESLASGEGPALLLLLMPGLVALAAAIIVARLFPPLARLIAGGSRRGLAGRLAAVGLGRGSGAAVTTVGFLTIAFALALVAEGYRATLTRGEHEQSAFAVPLDVSVREDVRTLVRVFDAAPLDRFRELAGKEGAAYPVLRVSGGAGRAEEISGVTVLGLDRGAIERLGIWRPEWAGGASRTRLAEIVDPGAEVGLRGAAIPGNAIVLRVGPGLVSFAAAVETLDGDFRRVELGEAHPTQSRTLRATVPRGSKLVSLQVIPPPRLIEGGADAGNALAGTSRLTGEIAAELRGWIGFDGVEVSPAPGGIDLRYVLTPQRRARIRAPQPTDTAPPRVLVTPRLAELAGGVGGILPVQIGGARVSVTVAGVVDRFPGAAGQLVVGDRSALRTAVNAVAPGAARENEVWLDVPDARASAVNAALARPPLRALSATTRRELEADARRDPLARGTLLALGAAAVIALLLAAAGLALAVRSDLRDERGDLYDLEAQGASPSLLRRVVRLRALALSIAGLAAGAVVGAALVMLVTRMVAVTARGGAAEPPLAPSLDPAVIAVGGAVYIVLALLLVGATTRRAFANARGPTFRDVE